MLESLPKETKASVRKLRTLLGWAHSCASVEELDAYVSRTKEEIADYVITVLIREDEEKQRRFLSES